MARKSAAEIRRDLKRRLDARETLVVPGAANALTARLVQQAGFESVYVTGAGVANTFLGVPDIGLLSLQEIAAHVTAIAGAVDIPLIADADTGFGNAISVWHTIRTLERAGASAVQLEDQTFPKRCGHFAGKDTISADEMEAKVRAAVDAREDANLLIIARTDARAMLGLDEAIRRARLYREAGADVTFVEAPQTIAEIERVAREIDGPKVLNIVEGGKTPAISSAMATELGFALVLYANLPLVVSIHAVQRFLDHLRQHGSAEGGPPRASFEQRQAIVRKDFFDDLGGRYERD